jgi:three-Cys-motif partner protein
LQEQIGEDMDKTDVKNTMQIHSQAKVEFYSAYLSRYLQILCKSPYITQINIFDVFCGTGVYEDGNKGSPVVAFDDIIKIKDANTRISLIINDKEKDKIARVKSYIENQNNKTCNVEYFNLDIEEMFEKVYTRVSQTSQNARNLIFIDPYGYKDIRNDILYKLMENGKTEIILFLPISHMHRFTQAAMQDESIVQYMPLRKFINSFFSENHPIRTEKLQVMEYISHIAKALKYADNFFTTSYYIERDKTNYFALFFMTSHEYGFEKILEVKWELDENAGRGFTLPEAPGFFDDFIAEQTKNDSFKRLESILINALESPKTNRQIYKLTLANEYLPKHTNEIFKRWQAEKNNFKVYQRNGGKEARKNAFYLNQEADIVNFILEAKS